MKDEEIELHKLIYKKMVWEFSNYSESLGYYAGAISMLSCVILTFTILPMQGGSAIHSILLIFVQVLIGLGVHKFVEYLKVKKALDMLNEIEKGNKK